LNGMANTLTIYLLNISGVEIRITGLNIIPYFISQISYDEYEFGDTRFPHLIDDYAQHGFAGQWNQRLGLRITMGAKFGACARYWNYCLHVNPRLLQDIWTNYFF